MSLLPTSHCLAAAVATPLTLGLRPDMQRMIDFTRHLFAHGVDGITIFGTTGEGPEFTVSDRMATLDGLISAGIEPQRIIVSVGALAIEDSIELLRHATSHGVYGCLLMTPCMYRGGITDDGVFEYYRQIIERSGHHDLRLFVYNFPEISGVTISLPILRRLAEKYPGIIAGVKDSGGDPELTKQYILSFSELSIFTGNEFDLPELNPLGLTGTVCGLANTMPGFMRALTDTRNSYEGRPFVEALRAADAILSRYPFIPSAKAIIANTMHDNEWLRLMPPMVQPPAPQRTQIVDAFRKWEDTAAGLVADFVETPVPNNVTPIKIA